LNRLAAAGAVLRRDTPGLVRSQTLGRQGRRSHWKWLRRRNRLAWHVARWRRTLFDGKHRRAGLAMQHVEKAGLVALNDDRHLASVPGDRGQERRRGGVVVPEIVVHELEAPRDFPRLRAQRDDGVGPLIVTGPQSSVVIGARTAGRH